MRRANLILLLLSYCYACAGQSIHYPVVTPYNNLAAYSKQFVTPLSGYANTSSLASMESFTAAVYGERRFMLAETSLYNAAVILPTTSGNFAFTSSFFGYSGYNESELSLGYARKIATNVDIGAAFNYYGMHIPGYGNAAAVHFQTGALFHISEQLHTGIQVYNPFSTAIGKQNNPKLASCYRAGLGYEWSASVFTALEIIKEQDKPADIHVGLQYKPISMLITSAGYTGNNNHFYFGIGYFYKQLRLDVSASFHQYMGLSPGLLLIYQPQRKQQP